MFFKIIHFFCSLNVKYLCELFLYLIILYIILYYSSFPLNGPEEKKIIYQMKIRQISPWV